MTAELHGLIADLLNKLGIDDSDGFAGRAADAIASKGATEEAAIAKAIAGVKTEMFLRNRRHSKQEIIDRLANRVSARASTIGTAAIDSVAACSVVFLAAAPRSECPLAIDEERRKIEQKVRGAAFASKMSFVDKWAIRPDDLLQVVNETSPMIVHFSGHGAAQGICLADEGGSDSQMVSGTVLSAVFKQFENPPSVVLLNSCYSESQAKAILGVVDCVIGMSDTIDDRSAAAFAGSFYRAIASGRSILRAFEQGKLSIDLESLPGTAVPVLLQRSSDSASIVLLGN